MMLTRRDLIERAVAAGVLLSGRVAWGKASQPTTSVNFAVPYGACDCHTHIFGDPAQFPFSPNRVYTPETALPEEMTALHHALHVQRVVIVTPSVYGTDNSATLDGIKARGPDARGVAVIDEKTPASDLDAMEQAGIRGVRLNLATAGQNDPIVARRLFQSAVERIRRLKWHVQINTNLAVIVGIKDLVKASPIPVVFDHFGGAQASLGTAQPGWSDLLDLVSAGSAYVKLSAAYNVSNQAPDYPDVRQLARSLVLANADRLLWGSDWPHPNSNSSRPATEITPLRAIDDGRLFNQLRTWAQDPSVRKKILVDNPVRLYRF